MRHGARQYVAVCPGVRRLVLARGGAALEEAARVRRVGADSLESPAVHVLFKKTTPGDTCGAERRGRDRALDRWAASSTQARAQARRGAAAEPAGAFAGREPVDSRSPRPFQAS